MERFRRWLVNGAAGLLAVLCVAMVGVAIQGWFYCEVLGWWGAIAPEGHQDWVYVRPWVGQGQMVFMRYSFAPAVRAQFVRSIHARTINGQNLKFPAPLAGFEFRPPARYGPTTASAFFKENRLFGLFSFGLERINFDLAKDWGGKPHILENGYTVTFPLWLPAFLLGLYPGIVIFRRRRERLRSKVGFCVKCGYDLRATPERCPECGTISAR